MYGKLSSDEVSWCELITAAAGDVVDDEI